MDWCTRSAVTWPVRSCDACAWTPRARPCPVPGRPCSSGIRALASTSPRRVGWCTPGGSETPVSGVWISRSREPASTTRDSLPRHWTSTRLTTRPMVRSWRSRQPAREAKRSGYRRLTVPSARQMTSMGGPLCANPRWSPDGRAVVFDSTQHGVRHLYRLDVETAEVRQLTSGSMRHHQARWSRDGRWIYFGAYSDEGPHSPVEIRRMPADGGPSVRITPGSVAEPSHDGRWLFVARERRRSDHLVAASASGRSA